MTDAITWGEPIEVCDRPAWLTNDQDNRIQWKVAGNWYEPETWRDWNGSDWDHVPAIRLPADHPVYQVIAWNKANPDAQPFEPWPGGDAAPGDWDGDRVLLRSGIFSPQPVRWQHYGEGQPAGYGDIVGYRRRGTAQLPGAITADTVTIARMTEGQALLFAEGSLTVDNGWAANTTQIRAAVTAMKALGLILPEPTPAERCAAALGISPDLAEKVLAWRDEVSLNRPFPAPVDAVQN